jgi:SAM-dependent methyltransferase
MATFGDADYNSNAYRDHRPTYTQELYDAIMKFHLGDLHTKSTGADHSKQQECETQRKDRLHLAVDVGSGTGQATIEIAKLFDQVIGVEPSDVQRKGEYTVSHCLVPTYLKTTPFYLLLSWLL